MSEERNSFESFSNMIADYINADTKCIEKLLEENSKLKEKLKEIKEITEKHYPDTAMQKIIELLGESNE